MLPHGGSEPCTRCQLHRVLSKQRLLSLLPRRQVARRRFRRGSLWEEGLWG